MKKNYKIRANPPPLPFPTQPLKNFKYKKQSILFKLAKIRAINLNLII